MDRHGNPPGYRLYRDLGEALALGNGEVQRFTLVVRPGDGGGASADMEIEQALERL